MHGTRIPHLDQSTLRSSVAEAQHVATVVSENTCTRANTNQRQLKASLAGSVTAIEPLPPSASALPGRQQPSAPIMLRVRSLLAAHRPLHLSRSAARFAQGWKGMQTLCYPCAHTLRWPRSQIWLGEGSLGVETVDAAASHRVCRSLCQRSLGVEAAARVRTSTRICGGEGQGSVFVRAGRGVAVGVHRGLRERGVYIRACRGCLRRACQRAPCGQSCQGERARPRFNTWPLATGYWRRRHVYPCKRTPTTPSNPQANAPRVVGLAGAPAYAWFRTYCPLPCPARSTLVPPCV